MSDKNRKKIYIFDTTLRDGEQSPGVSLGVREKIEIAKALEYMKVDFIEAGFPITSPGDYDAVKRISREIKGSTVSALARSVQKDMDVALDALSPAKRKRLHVFLATSAVHRKFKLKKAKSEIERMAVWAVRYAKSRIDDVEFSPEDASRTERDFLYRIIESTIKAGARVVNIPDTVGYTTPYEFKSLIQDIMHNVPNINKAMISVHCHNDLGLAVANSLSAILGGARQVECTINGVGERAGNAALEEIVMALDTRKDLFKVTTSIKKKAIAETSKLVSNLTGMIVQPNKAIVGRNAFAHESGIHQHGVLKKRTTYEIMNPKDVGYGESNIVLGKHSGRHAFEMRLKRMGVVLKSVDIEKAFERFKDLADKKKEIFEDDLRALIDSEVTDRVKEFELAYLKVSLETGKPPFAKIKIMRNRKLMEASGTGDGPVDAAYKTLDKMIKERFKLIDYVIRSVTIGKDAQGEVQVLLKTPKGIECRGRGVSTDVIEASVRAYLDAVNKIKSLQRRSRANQP